MSILADYMDVTSHTDIMYEISWILANMTFVDDPKLIEEILNPEYRVIEFCGKLLLEK